MKKHTLTAAVLLVGIVLGIGVQHVRTSHREGTAVPAPAPVAAPRAPAPPPQIEDPKAVYRVPVEDSPVRGPSDALVTIVESSDFECPFCRRVTPTLERIAEAYRGKVRFVFKHNPLSMHPNALPAAIVAEEARAQGGDAKFWAAHDELLALSTVDRAALLRVADALGLSRAKVQGALERSTHLARVARDQSLLATLGARGTPTFFVNGRKVTGAQPYEAFAAVIDEELARAEALLRAGTAPKDLYARLIERGATAPVLLAAAASPRAEVPTRPDDPSRGEKRARVTIVEFSDFQCPFCAKAVAAVEEVEGAFGADVRVVWKHMPLAFHANALPAAMAAEAARGQGRFWEMHDRLFADAQALSEATYLRHAKELGLDLAIFERDLRSPAVRARVEEDMRAAAAAGVTGTPTFVVNGELVKGAGGLRDAVARQLDGARMAKR